MQTHGAALVVVQRDHEKVKAQKLLQALSQLVKKHRQVAMRGDDAGDLHEGEIFVGRRVASGSHIAIA